jgi:Protein of unknown function (DUF4233)
MRRLCATVLIMEAVVIALAIAPAITIAHARPVAAGTTWGALAVLAVLLAAVVGRPGQRWALVGGSVLQILVIVTGVVVPVMYGLGAVFAVLWVTAIWLARRYQVP